MLAYLFDLILCSYPINVDAEAHELSKTLLTKESLSLQIALLDRFGREDLRSNTFKKLN